MPRVGSGSSNFPGGEIAAKGRLALAMRCPSCNSDNQPGSKFCCQCGGALAPQPARRSAPANESSFSSVTVRFSASETIATGLAEFPDAERKTLTALFADIEGSTALTEQLDPEQARNIIDPALSLMIEGVHHYEGYLAQSTGDGIFALFGAPIAHEDHPQRALHAALRIQKRLKQYSARMRAEGKLPIQARVGISTGEVVVRTINTGWRHTEYLPIGHTTNLAARIQSVAPPGSIAISHHTRVLVEGYFELKSLGSFRLKGVKEPVEVHEVVGLGLLQTRLQVSEQRGFTIFVGRQAEIGHLMNVLEVARSGRGRIVAIEADAGLGKSRLLHEFKRLLDDDSLVLETFSVSHGKTLAYLPIIELLKSYFGIENDDAEAARRAKLTDKVLSLDAGLHEVLPHLQRMLEITVAGDPTAEMDPQIRRQRTHDAIKRILIRASVERPLILIFEDLHWIDGETQALLDLLADSIATSRILMLVTYRPEYRHNWDERSYYSQIKLDYLGTDSTGEMLNALLGDEPALVPLKHLIHQRTEGNPFFIEETVRTLFERGILTRNGTVKLTRALSETVLPHTVQGLIASRIDLLPAAERDLLQTLSVMGRSFPLSLVGRVIGQPDDAVEQMLSTLRRGQFIYEQSISSDVEYAFKHALTQEVAYRSLLAEQRSALHRAIGDAKEELFAGHLEDHLGELAYHYRQGGDIEKAIKYLELMGRQALRRSAYGDALNALSGAVDLLKTLPPNEERRRKQIRIGLAVGIALTASKGYAVPEAQDLAVWMLELSREVNDPQLVVGVLLTAWSFYLNGGDLRRAREIGEQMIQIAQGHKALAWKANFALGVTLFWIGEPGHSSAYIERSIEEYDPAMRSGRSGGLDPGITSMVYRGWLLWILGYPDAAVAALDHTVQIAKELSLSFSLALALLFSAAIRQLRREPEKAFDLAEQSIQVANTNGFPVWVALGLTWRGWALTQLNRAEEGIAQMLEGAGPYSAIGQQIALSQLLGLLAEGYLASGQLSAALDTIERALARAQDAGEHFFEAELHRLKGRTVLSQPNPLLDEARACFDRALAIARGQGSKSYELRAALDLARMLRDQGKPREARELVAEIYGWFTEGFDTPDLKDAKALLSQLS